MKAVQITHLIAIYVGILFFATSCMKKDDVHRCDKDHRGEKHPKEYYDNKDKEEFKDDGTKDEIKEKDQTIKNESIFYKELNIPCVSVTNSTIITSNDEYQNYINTNRTGQDSICATYLPPSIDFSQYNLAIYYVTGTGCTEPDFSFMGLSYDGSSFYFNTLVNEYTINNNSCEILYMQPFFILVSKKVTNIQQNIKVVTINL